MNKIDVKHTAIVINDYDLGDCKQLENCFSIYDRIRHEKKPYGMHYDEEQRKLYIPRGVDIYFIEKLLGCKARVDTTRDPYDKIDSMQIKYRPRDDVQMQAIKFMCGIDNQKFTRVHSQLSVNLTMGKGKTYCSIISATLFKLRTCILTSSIDWLEQWKDKILEYTDSNPTEILIVSSKHTSIQMLLRKDLSNIKFILMSIDSVKSYANNFGWDKVTELFKFMRIGLKFYDEAHLNYKGIQMIDYYTDTMKTFYVTGTPAKSSEEENKIYQLAFKNVPSISLFDEDNDPHAKYLGTKYKSNPTPFDRQEVKGVYGIDRNKYTNYIVKNEEFYKMLCYCLNMAIKRGGKTIIYIGTIKAIEEVATWFGYFFPEFVNDYGMYNSKIDSETKQAVLNKRFIFSTTKSLGTAQDIPGLRNLILAAEPFKSEVLAAQVIGRLRDDDTLMMEMVDISFQECSKYYSNKKTVNNKLSTKCLEHRFIQSELNEKYNMIKAEQDEFRNSKFIPIMTFIDTSKLKSIMEFV